MEPLQTIGGVEEFLTPAGFFLADGLIVRR
jgi:hypothetical protein